MRIVRTLLLLGGVAALIFLIHHFGVASITSALTRIAWWQLVLICLVYGVSVLLDTLGWRLTFVGARPPFWRLLAARCAGQAVNVVTALGGVGGEAIKAWLLRRDVPYETSVPSLILAKTAEIIGQTLLVVTGLLVAWATGAVGPTLLRPMSYLLAVQVVAVGGFILVQVTGGVGRVGRLLAWVGGGRGVRRIDGAVRTFYRAHWRTLFMSIGFHYISWLVGALEALLILRSLQLPATLVTATIIEAINTGVRFATFFVPANLGTLEGANAAAFAALGWAASDGLAFSFVRRGRQMVWIGLGLAILVAMGATRASAVAPAVAASTRPD
jgi:glycosyltransferase 2 family protein